MFRAKILVPVFAVVAAVAAVGIYHAGRVDWTRSTRDEWGQLFACLAQGEEPKDARELAARVRAVELHYATEIDARLGRRQRKEWLDRCAMRATRLHDYASRGTEPAQLRLRDAAEELADSLRAGRRPTEQALRDTLEAGAAVGLRLEALPSVRTAVDARSAHISLSDPALVPLADTQMSLLAWDAVPSMEAHLLFGSESKRVACIASGEGNAALSRLSCTAIPDGAKEDTRFRWEGVVGTDVHALAMIGESGASVHTWSKGAWSAVPTAAVEPVAFLATNGQPALLRRTGGALELLPLAVAAPKAARLASPLREAAWAVDVGDELLFATARPGQGPARVLAAPLGRVTAPAPPTTMLGSRVEAGVPLACQDGKTRALLVDRERAGGGPLASRSADLFVARGADWKQVTVTPTWTTRPTVGVSFPRTAVLDCTPDEVVITAADGDDQERIQQTRCAGTECRSGVTHLGIAVRDGLLADLRKDVLLVWNDAEHHVVRMRKAKLDALAKTRDEIVVDYDDGTSDPSPVRAEHIVERDDAALILLRAERKEGTQMFVVRVGADGSVTPLGVGHDGT